MTAEDTRPPTFVFVHGFMGCDEIALPFFPIQYFRGVKALMMRLGLPCLMPRLPQGAATIERAAHLVRALDAAGVSRCVLVGMSQGGLDSRYVAAKLDPARLDADRRVRAVATLGTPHRGSWLADWALESRSPLPSVIRRFARPALEDLRPAACAKFNHAVPDRPDIPYLSWAGQRPVGELPLWLRPFGTMLEAREGDNDGQVSVASARWGDFRGIVRADHYEFLGWNFGLPRRGIIRPFPHLGLYEEVARSVVEAVA